MNPFWVIIIILLLTLIICFGLLVRDSKPKKHKRRHKKYHSDHEFAYKKTKPVSKDEHKSYIVKFKEGCNPDLKDKIVHKHKYHTILNGVAGKIKDEHLDHVRSHPDVEYIEEDLNVEICKGKDRDHDREYKRNKNKGDKGDKWDKGDKGKRDKLERNKCESEGSEDEDEDEEDPWDIFRDRFRDRFEDKFENSTSWNRNWNNWNNGDVNIPNTIQVVPWEIDRIGANLSSTKSGDGYGEVDIDVYVLDTGIQIGHPDLNVVGGISFIDTEPSYTDYNGHGTHCSGIVAAKDNNSSVVGICPGARLWAVKVLDRTGNGSLSSVIAGLDYILAMKKNNPNRPFVVNMSLGGNVGTNNYNSLDTAVQICIDAGVTICIAAGNNGEDAQFSSPSHVRDAITVGAFDTSNRFANFSNYGATIDICAPGVNILSTFLGGGTKILSGTSMATPVVTGTIALMLADQGNLPPHQVKEKLIDAALNPRYSSSSQPASNPRISGVPANTTNLSVFTGNF